MTNKFDISKKDKYAIKIQSIWRGQQIRKMNKKLNDSMSYDLLNKSIDNFNITINNEKEINKLLKKKKNKILKFSITYL